MFLPKKVKQSDNELSVFLLCFMMWKDCREQPSSSGCHPLLVIGGTDRPADSFLWILGAQRHFACEDFLHIPVWSLDGQRAAHLESLLCFLNSWTGPDPRADWIPIQQPADLCKRQRLSGQTEQSGFVGLELSSGGREERQDRRRETGAWKTTEDSQETTGRDITSGHTHWGWLGPSMEE